MKIIPGVCSLLINLAPGPAAWKTAAYWRLVSNLDIMP